MAKKPSLVGLRIKQARQLRGYSQPELARRSGIQQSTISHIENGITDPRSASISALAQALDVTRGWLYGETGFDPEDALISASPSLEVEEERAGYSTTTPTPIPDSGTSGSARTESSMFDELAESIADYLNQSPSSSDENRAESITLTEVVIRFIEQRYGTKSPGIAKLREELGRLRNSGRDMQNQ